MICAGPFSRGGLGRCLFHAAVLLVVLDAHPCDAAAGTPRTFAEIIDKRPLPDLNTLAKRCVPELIGPDATESFYDLLKLREAGDAKAVPVLERILLDNLRSTRIHGFAAAQALFCIGSAEAHQALTRHLSNPHHRTGMAVNYTFHWEMTEPNRTRFISQYLLTNLASNLAIRLEELPAPPANPERVAFKLVLRNTSDKPFHIQEPQVYLGSLLYFQNAQENFVRYVRGRMTLDYQPPMTKWVELPPGGTRDYTIAGTVKAADPQEAAPRWVADDSSAVLDMRDCLFDIGQPGPFVVRALFEATPLNEWQRKQVTFDNAWVGRAVSPAIKVTLPVPTEK